MAFHGSIKEDFRHRMPIVRDSNCSMDTFHGSLTKSTTILMRSSTFYSGNHSPNSPFIFIHFQSYLLTGIKMGFYFLIQREKEPFLTFFHTQYHPFLYFSSSEKALKTCLSLWLHVFIIRLLF